MLNYYFNKNTKQMQCESCPFASKTKMRHSQFTLKKYNRDSASFKFPHCVISNFRHI